jgi:uncharacterized protein YlaI
VVSCWKVRYTSRAKAQRALDNIRRRGERGTKKPSRAYLCDNCHGWHLTSEFR